MILPNFGAGSTPDRIRHAAEAAEALGFDSVWTTEHIVVGPEAVDPYGRVYDPLVTLGWIAGWTERIGLGTSVLILPLHNPFQLAKQVATLQELSRGRVTVGVGVGWHRDEFEFMGVPFAGRGRRADEAIRVVRALWAGERSFHGRWWSFGEATAEPIRRRSPRSGSAAAPSARSGERASSVMPGIPRVARPPTTSAASGTDTQICG